MRQLSKLRSLALAMMLGSAFVASSALSACTCIDGGPLLTREERIEHINDWQLSNSEEYRQPHRVYRHRPPTTAATGNDLWLAENGNTPATDSPGRPGGRRSLGDG